MLVWTLKLCLKVAAISLQFSEAAERQRLAVSRLLVVRSDGKSTTKNNKIKHRRHEDLIWKTLLIRKRKTHQIFTISDVCL